MNEKVKKIFYDSAGTLKRFVDENCGLVVKCANVMADALRDGHKILFFGNGGSAADAQHLAAEFVNRFLMQRGPLAAIALTTDTSILTSVANDSSFEEIFSRQVAALGRKGDIAFGISTSGNSPNVVKALFEAKKQEMFTIALTGKTGGNIKNIVDLHINVDSFDTPRIQETHITIGHALCHLIEENMIQI